ncbi:hypothetical protein [Roseateles saccharophilus]|uniref:Uncharacterized protein n=1 Tax=Roseateles saccharophilus TaxID=304 RepID=A0A4V6P2P5_ROSSA|nr:hypothetical protein [Roseateles saccharophilus]MDG0831965.1 hypothetical protein [Roseateles saccharophilus]TCU97369.1 hypothetical protein EV671_101144 [Roseateles saccharophilus]
MKPVTALTLAVLTLVAFGAIAEGIAPRRVDDAETQTLKAKVADLQRRLDALEARVEQINMPKLQKVGR